MSIYTSVRVRGGGGKREGKYFPCNNTEVYLLAELFQVPEGGKEQYDIL